MLRLTTPRSVRATTAASLLTLAALGASAQTLDTPPAPEVGDKWTFRFHNKGDKWNPHIYTSEVKSIDGTSVWILGETQQANVPPKHVRRHDLKRDMHMESFEFDPAAINGAGRRTEDHQKNDAPRQYPLAIGKKFSVKQYWSDGNGYREWKTEVEAYEKVTVEAGTFDAFRIKYSGWWTRTAGGTGTGRSEWVQWYSPVAKSIVKEEGFNRTSNNMIWNQSITELVKWEPAPKAKNP